MPFSHRLPEYRALYPQYDRNLVRVAQALAATEQELLVIDVGANVGDTMALLRDSLDCRYLCIEGSPLFLPYLRLNARGLSDVQLLEAFISPETGSQRVRLETRGGSARLVHDPEGRPMAFVTLAEALSGVVQPDEAILLKLDTDGFDLPIVKASLTLLEQLRPVLFLEFFPRLDQQDGATSVTTFASLAQAGYKVCQVYSNSGDYLFSFSPSEVKLVEDLYLMLESGGPLPYLDLCLYPAERIEVAENVRRQIHRMGRVGP
jgi:FkbM family methyltransferase